MPLDKELESFINEAQGKQRSALCIVSRGIRGSDLSGVNPMAVFSREVRETDDLNYLKDKLQDEGFKQIVEFIKTNPEQITQIQDPGINSDFKNQNRIFRQLKSAAAAGAGGGGPGGGGPTAATILGFAAASAAAPAPPAPFEPAAAEPPPAFAGGRGCHADESLLTQGAEFVDQGLAAAIAAAGGLGPALYGAGQKIANGCPEEALKTLSDGLGRAVNAGVEKGSGLSALGTGWGAAADGGGGGGGGGGVGGAAPPTPDAVDAQPNPVLADDEAERKKQLLELLNTSSRPCLQVFDEYDQKKKQYDAKLENFLWDDPIYKKNKDSAFINFISPSDKPGENNAFLPYVTKTDFHKILKQDSFANTANQYAVACKMELGNDEKIMMGADEIGDQYFIDVQNSLKQTRIFLSKDNFKKLEEYKKDLVEVFKELLKNNISNIGVSTKKQIEDKIFKFDSIKAVKNAIGGNPVPPAPTESLASIVCLTSTDDIDKHAQILADQFWQRKLVKGDLSVEVEKIAPSDEYEEAKRLSHIKIERTDKDEIKVYKVGNDKDIDLKYVNLGMGDQFMQIEVEKITKDGVTGVEYFKQHTQEKNNFNVRVDDKKDLNETVTKAKVDVFVEDLDNKQMSRFKIRNGDNKSNKRIGKIAIGSQPLAEVPKIFTIGDDDLSDKIGTANGYRFGYVGLEAEDVDIKIRRSKNGKYKIHYENENINCCRSPLSTTKRTFFINPVINKIDDNNVRLVKKGAFLRRSWFFSKDSSCFKTGDTESIKIFVEDKVEKKIVELEITQEGSMKGSFKDFFRAKRNNNVVRVVSERSTVPPTTFQPQNVFCPSPHTAPGAASAGR